MNKAAAVKSAVEKEGSGSSEPTIFHVLLNSEARAEQGKESLSVEQMGAVGWLLYIAAAEVSRLQRLLSRTFFFDIHDRQLQAPFHS
jgi:hypothetical protein